ncbi:MAG: dioxygenase, partial [Rhodoferax sp.]|nr:dioxygenase [Rhodoferax sp.]
MTASASGTSTAAATPLSTAARLPVYFVSHGGGPWPWVDGMRERFARTEAAFRALPARLP